MTIEDNQTCVENDTKGCVNDKEEQPSTVKKKVLVLKKKQAEVEETTIEKDQLVLPDFNEIKESIKSEEKSNRRVTKNSNIVDSEKTEELLKEVLK